MRTPEKRLRTKWGALLALLLLVIGLVLLPVLAFLYSAIPSIYSWAFLGWIGLAVLGMIYIRKKYTSWGFEIREDHLYIQHGVFKTVKTMAPFVRIQHVDTQRGVLDRLFGLSKVVVYTAGSRGADITIPGLSPGDAETIQERLRDVAIESEDRDAV